MASYEQLSAQQRAIIDLIVKRGQSYDQLAEKLAMPRERVREIAHQALAGLAPVSAAAVDDSWRDRVADHLLGQQDEADAAATRGHLERSEAARAWSRSVLDSLEHLYPAGALPAIPSGGGAASGDRPPATPGSPPARKTAAKAEPATGQLSPAAAAIVRRRRIAAVAAGVLLLAFVVLIWPIGLLGGDDDSSSPSASDGKAGGRTELVGYVRFRPVARGSKAEGEALITRTGDRFELALQARLTPTKRNQAYEVWLYDSAKNAVSLGAQVTDDSGIFAGRAELPSDYRDYRYIDISRERVDRNTAHSGVSVLRAATKDIQKPPAQEGGQGGGGADR